MLLIQNNIIKLNKLIMAASILFLYLTDNSYQIREREREGKREREREREREIFGQCYQTYSPGIKAVKVI
jgi:hypothetical protein